MASACGLIVTGASGWLGRAVVQLATTLGCVVVAASRRSVAQKGSTRVEFDLQYDDVAIAKTFEPLLAAAPTWALIHCAGLAHVSREDAQACERLYQINVEGTARLVRTCLRVGVQRFVNVSSISVYDWARGRPERPHTEVDPVGPKTEYGKTKLAGERIVAESNLDWRVARLATVFGSDDRANFARLATAIRRRRFVVPGVGDQRKSCIDIDTAARTLVALALLPDPATRIVNIGFPESPTLAEITAALAALFSLPSPPNIPIAALQMAAWCGSIADRLKLPAPITSRDLERLCAWTWVDSSLAAEMFPELASATFAAVLERSSTYYSQC
jgi:nucleoside-diphosphate-sugar epimerase